MNQAFELIEGQGAKVVRNVHLVSLAEIVEQGGTDIDDLIGKFSLELSNQSLTTDQITTSPRKSTSSFRPSTIRMV